jgi:hypothetical protein
MRRRISYARALVFTSAMLAVSGSAAPAESQVRFRDLVVTLGGSAESYSGNFSAVTLPIVDSTEDATAAVGEVAVSGSLILLGSRTRSFDVSFDGGMRQAAAFGFEELDYAPREWVGSVSPRFIQGLGSWGSLRVRGLYRGRSVQDRPPMPLFLQPGYSMLQGVVGLITRSFDGLSFDARVDVEETDYGALALVPQLDLLDRRSSGVEVGLRWGATSTIRVHGGLRWTEYSNQGSFDPDDPFRRDRTARVGMEWTHSGHVFAQVGLDGAMNRSNSDRPEYDAVSFRALVTTPLPAGFSLNAYAVLTDKGYLHETDFARLVPGEEADNASIAYLQVGRSLASNLDGAVRLGWTRAETDFGQAYYERFGLSVHANYRPLTR